MNVRRSPLRESEPEKISPQLSPSVRSPTSIDVSSYMAKTSEPASPTDKQLFTSNNIGDLDSFKSKVSPGIKQYLALRASLEPNTVFLL